MSGARGRLVRVAIYMVIGLVMFDESGVAVALTEIRESFDLSPTQANWVVSAYLLSLSAAVAACGRLADLLGLGRVFIAGSLVFGAMSVAAGLAPSYEWLIVARVLQGLGAAAAFPAGASIIRATTAEGELGRALGQLGLATAIGLAAGPFLGGLLTQWISWRAVFFVSAPVVAFVVAVIASQLEPLERESSQGSFDFGGLVLLLIALGATVGGLMQGPVWGWASPTTLALFAAGAIAGVALLWVERRRTGPLIEIDLFRDPTFSSANAMTFLAQFSKTSVVIYGPLFLIDVLGLGTFQAGLALLPGILAAMPSAPLGGRAVDRLGARRPLLGSLALLAASLAYFAAVVGLRSYAWLVPGLLVWGVANTCVFVCSRRAVHGAVPATKAGQASGINSTAQWLGAALSVPILGVFVVSPPEHFARVYGAAALFVVAASLLALARFQPSTGQRPAGSRPIPA